jgi:hypothetical protein
VRRIDAQKARLRTSVQDFLGPDEKVRDAFGALRLHSVGIFQLPPPFMQPLIVARTDRNLVVLEARRFQWSVPRRVLARFPEMTKVGPIRGRGGAWMRLLGLEMRMGGRIKAHHTDRESVSDT